jgi:hypothetical protein
MLIQFPLSGEEQTFFNYEFWQRTGLESAKTGLSGLFQSRLKAIQGI